MVKYILKFIENKHDISGNLLKKTKTYVKCNSRKHVFDIIPKLNELRMKRWNLYLKPGEIIKCSDITIVEPVFEKINGKRKRTGYKEYSKVEYDYTFCRNCGRMLTNAESIARGIGPECIKQCGSNKLTNYYLDKKIEDFTEKQKRICKILDKCRTKTECNSLIKVNEKWHNKEDLHAIGIYIIKRFI